MHVHSEVPFQNEGLYGELLEGTEEKNVITDKGIIIFALQTHQGFSKFDFPLECLLR